MSKARKSKPKARKAAKKSVKVKNLKSKTSAKGAMALGLRRVR